MCAVFPQASRQLVSKLVCSVSPQILVYLDVSCGSLALSVIRSVLSSFSTTPDLQLPKLSLGGRGATSEFSWQRHSRAAMAAAAADASHRITALTPEEEGRRTAAKLFGSAAPLPLTERERERDREKERKREEGGEEVGRASGNECLVCGALFTSPEKLRLHALSHTGEKPFHCSHPHCPKAFSSKYKLFRYRALNYIVQFTSF